ncbi:LytR C-terminal domain-containing protein [candidate division WOR-3 bacterium]|nr:LytR C-terminal domain-containing protein [candidate division WOR-3 bacterium]
MSDTREKKPAADNTGKIIIYIAVVLLGISLGSILFRHLREDPEEIYKKNSNMRVEVLNGCGINRLALKVTNALRKQGFNVVTIGNTQESDFEETVIIERSDENMKNARYFAGRIGCHNIGKDIDPALYIEVTLIIGKDYEKIFKDIENEF